MRTYEEADESEKTYIVVHGTLTFDPAEMPPTDLSAPNPEGRRLDATLAGKGLTKKGFTQDFAADITLNATCAGAWCARAEPGAEVLAFLEKSDAGYSLTITPCGGMAHQEPSEEDIDRVATCYAKGSC